MIVYVVPTKDRTIFNKHLGPSLEKSKGNKNVVLVDGESGICEKYNQVLEKIQSQISDNDVICFLHDDIELLDEQTSAKAELYFKYKSNVGIAGVIGSKKYYKENGGGWWHCQRPIDSAGHIIQGNPKGEDYEMDDGKGMFDDMVLVDGCILFMSGKVAKWFRFDSFTFRKYHFYDCDACFQLLEKGYDIGTIDITVKHVSEGQLSDSWFEEKNKFLKKWGNLPKVITSSTFKKD
jgi:hypothetical protein